MSSARCHWRLPFGAETSERGTRFRVWSPRSKEVCVVLESTKRQYPLQAERNGSFSALIPTIKSGDLYRYQLENGTRYPDPYSRSQPYGPHGPSMVIDPSTYSWKTKRWKTYPMSEQIFYELHIGTFTPQGTFIAAKNRLTYLKNLGITTIELMPLAECPGRWNWGYDGVDMFAPYHVYGTPNDLKAFVDTAHHLGINVILDVVYNHLGPDGNYLSVFNPYLFTKHGATTDWGDGLNYDGPHSTNLRKFVVNNACYWIKEYCFDGLRLDATQNIYDRSTPHILGEMSKAARKAAGPRRIVLVAENEPQDSRCLTKVEKGGFGLDGVWNDDFHHSARVAVTGFNESYFVDYKGRPQEFISLAKRGYLYQGQRYQFQNKNRGTWVFDKPASAFVIYNQNHDQIANHPTAKRFHQLTDDETYRALTGFLLLLPQTPLIFMGQEFCASSPFPFFCDQTGPLAEAINKGRKQFLSQFPSYAKPDIIRQTPICSDESTFTKSKLKWNELKRNSNDFKFHKDLFYMRRSGKLPFSTEQMSYDGAVIEDKCFLIRFFGKQNQDGLLIVNLGNSYSFRPTPEPLVALTPKKEWTLAWASDLKKYGGKENSRKWKESPWQIPARTTLWLKPT